SNSATSTSKLSASLATGPTLDVANPGGGTAASFETNKTAPPFTVTSKTKVANLNAAMVGGKQATDFLPVAGKAADSDKLDGLDSTAFLPIGGKAADSDKLDGIDSTGFVQGKASVVANGIAVNAGEVGVLVDLSGLARIELHCNDGEPNTL